MTYLFSSWEKAQQESIPDIMTAIYKILIGFPGIEEVPLKCRDFRKAYIYGDLYSIYIRIEKRGQQLTVTGGI